MADKFCGSLSSDHLQIKIPTGDSPYVKAKHVQLVEKDPNRAVALFWCAINSADRVDSALKDMAVVMKQLNRAEEAIEAIKSFRGLCSIKAQEPLDNVLLDLYKKCGRVTEQIDLLNHKLRIIDEGTAFGGKMMKSARSQGKKFHITVEQEKSRLLGNLAWAYMQCENYKEAEPLYRRALEIEKDYNKMCNLAICLMQRGRLVEAKILVADVKKPTDYSTGESYKKSFDRACEMMNELELKPDQKTVENNSSISTSCSFSNEKANTDDQIFVSLKEDDAVKICFTSQDLSSGTNVEKKTWADMVEEDENLACEDSEIGISPLKFAGRSWGDIAEEEDMLNNKNSEFRSHGRNQKSARRTSISSCRKHDNRMSGGYICGKQPNRLQVFQEITPGDAKA